MTRATLSGLLGIGAVAIATASGLAAVTIKRLPTKNQSISYDMTGSIDFQGPHTIGAKETDTITDVASDGNYTTKSEQTNLTFDGMPAPTQGGATTSVNKPDGSLVSIAGDAGAADQGRLATLTQFYYPSMPVSVGDTWSYEGKKDDKLGVVGFKADMKLLGDEKIGPIDTWKIQEDVKEGVGTTPATLHTMVWVDKTDGSMVKADSTFTDLPFPQVGALSGKMSFVRK